MTFARSEKTHTKTLFTAGVILLACATLFIRQAAASLPASTAPAGEDSSVRHEASIPFASHGAIVDWRSDGTKGIWVQAVSGKWFYGTFSGACDGLDSANNVGFVTNPSGSFDHWSWILVRGHAPCHLANFTASGVPPAFAMGSAQ